jgi:V8-like Glu-specific endopeptidase
MRIRPRSIPTPATRARPRSHAPARRAAAALALAGGFVAAVAAVPASATAAEGAPDPAVVGSAAVSSAADPAAAAAYWTPARRADALADGASSTVPTSVATESVTDGAARTGSGASAPVPHADEPFVGVLYYVADGRDRACTASVVRTTDGDAIATAAHCLVDRRTRTVNSLATFVPGARGAAAPHGIWPVRVASASTEWTATGRPLADVGFARVTAPAPASAGLAASVGAAQPVFGSALVPPTGEAPQLSILGYPAAGRPSAALESCSARPSRIAGGQIALPCTLAKGASGSPVLTATGEQHGVVARPSGDRVLLAAWDAEAERALTALHGL